MQNMGELMPDTDSLNDILSFDMDSMMNEAHRRVVLAAPLRLLLSVNLEANVIYTENNGVITITLPAVLRMIYISLVNIGGRIVYADEFVEEGSPIALRQYNKMTRGGINKPVVITHGTNIVVYSVPDGTITDSTTIPIGYYPDYDITTWGKDFPISSLKHKQLLLDAIAWMTTALLFDAMEENGNAEVARTRCNELLAL